MAFLPLQLPHLRSLALLVKQGHHLLQSGWQLINAHQTLQFTIALVSELLI